MWRTNKESLIPVVGVLLLGVGFRCVYFRERVGSAAASFGLLDSRLYLEHPAPVELGSVSAPYLALVRMAELLDPGTTVLVLIQMAIGLATVALVAFGAFQLAGTQAATIAALLLVLFAPQAMMESKVMPSTLITFVWALFWGSMLLPSWATSWRIQVATGCAFGACVTAWGGLWVGALVLGYAIVSLPRSRRGRGAGHVLFGLVATLLIAEALRHALLPVEALDSSHSGLTFYHGNNPRAVGSFSKPVGFSGDRFIQTTESITLASKAAGRALNASEADRFWWAQGAEFLTRSWLTSLQLFANKARLWFSNVELSSEYVLPVEYHLTPSLTWLVVPFSAIVGGAAFARTHIRSREVALLFLSSGVGLLVAIVFFFSSRYRLPFVPPLCVLAGCGWSRIARRAVRGRDVAVGLLAVVASWLAGLGYDTRAQEATQWYNLGNVAFRAGQVVLAQRLYEEGVALAPRRADLHFNLGLAYAQEGRYELACDQMAVVLGVEGDGSEAAQLLRRYESLSGRHR